MRMVRCLPRSPPMTWKGRHPVVNLIDRVSKTRVTLADDSIRDGRGTSRAPRHARPMVREHPVLHATTPPRPLHTTRVVLAGPNTTLGVSNTSALAAQALLVTHTAGCVRPICEANDSMRDVASDGRNARLVVTP